MRRAKVAILLVTLVAVMHVATACLRQNSSDVADEKPAPPDPMLVVTGNGLELTGPEARVDIRYRTIGQQPEVELFVSASAGSVGSWIAYVSARSEFLENLSMNVPVVVGRPLEPGEASVSLESGLAEPAATATADSGFVELELKAGRLKGMARGMQDKLRAEFEGPFVVTCAVPTTFLATSAPTPAKDNEHLDLVVDNRFASDLCQPFRDLGE